RFAANPLVTGEPYIRFYAGAPLLTEDGFPLGSLCVIDRVPRAGLTPLQAQGLRAMASQIMAAMGSRRKTRLQAKEEAVARQALSETEQKFRILADTMPQMVWSTRADGFHDYYNARWYEFTGMPVGSTDGAEWNGMFHPEDQDRAWTIWQHSLATGAPYQIEYRLRRADGQYRWTLGRALPMYDDNGTIVRWFGTCTDIHEQKEASEQREIVAHELSHRIKNIFAVISGLINLSAR
ncbi:PAS domain-containing protein, partial [Pseudomonas proteolytica]|uniref:PAS domain-containing protein n=1 Tax=Pseudomonas proteolytica TaxID=219574 RepID=UPI0030D6EFD7